MLKTLLLYTQAHLVFLFLNMFNQCCIAIVHFLFAYVVAQAEVNFGISFMSCSVNGNFAVIATS